MEIGKSARCSKSQEAEISYRRGSSSGWFLLRSFLLQARRRCHCQDRLSLSPEATLRSAKGHAMDHSAAWSSVSHGFLLVFCSILRLSF
ncbi:hypothetical protein M406DRAFT_101949 [Cryphonectria parasitica EP155]|uniref:Uncharacterized protein n=1 Tax=Cryphonectria parasitica (strain ATCC 38755 / EP155) TaxID=660469 RepID=A0A9P4Y5Z7_CRYP1|nr:uncharacterized protein M406DRAFT_101949 [Cryphonectria parasitica EP155]KAF3767338.1 hypothetical protein M406DRAFT_101949 [Cryphonectria parasitica EP155]